MAQVLQRLVMLLAFTGAFLVPVIARAAVLAEASELDEPSMLPPSSLPAPSHDVCISGDVVSSVPVSAPRVEHAAVDDIDDAKAGGMCDDRGACVVAPPRVHPVGSARIQAVRGCSFGGHGPAAWIGPGHDDVPGPGAAPVLANHAVLAVPVLVAPASSELGPAFLPVTGGPRLGVARGVERPPR